MLGLLIFGGTVYAGAAAHRLGWRPFAVLLVIALLGVALKTSTVIQNRAFLGEDASYLRDPAVFAGNTAATFALYALAYLAAYAVGRWWRRRKGASNK